MGDFQNSVAFVAGASGGINLAIARQFAKLGAKVGLISRNAERIESAATDIRRSGGSATGIRADVRNYDEISQAAGEVARTFGPIDVVVSGAAGNFLAPASELSANGFRTVVEIDLIGTFNVYRACLAHLRTPGASLVAITAPQGSRPFARQAHACAAKAGINMLTRALALEWGHLGIRVNAVSPGPIADTEGVRRLWPENQDTARLTKDIPLGRLGACSDIERAVVWLASPAAAFVTGTILDVDGGFAIAAASRSMAGPQ